MDKHLLNDQMWIENAKFHLEFFFCIKNGARVAGTSSRVEPILSSRIYLKLLSEYFFELGKKMPSFSKISDLQLVQIIQ